MRKRETWLENPETWLNLVCSLSPPTITFFVTKTKRLYSRIQRVDSIWYVLYRRLQLFCFNQKETWLEKPETCFVFVCDTYVLYRRLQLLFFSTKKRNMTWEARDLTSGCMWHMTHSRVRYDICEPVICAPYVYVICAPYVIICSPYAYIICAPYVICAPYIYAWAHHNIFHHNIFPFFPQ